MCKDDIANQLRIRKSIPNQFYSNADESVGPKNAMNVVILKKGEPNFLTSILRNILEF